MQKYFTQNKKTSLRGAPVNHKLSYVKIWNIFQKSLTLITPKKVTQLMKKDLEGPLVQGSALMDETLEGSPTRL